jgi:diguanylate cyclase (GGDEF)-like protein/PAS domain S-box-containing protein
MPCTHLEPDSRAPAQARAFTAELLADASEELRGRVCQVVTELVTNSVRYSGGLDIVVEAVVDEHGAVDLDVRDEGPGFDAPPRAPGHAEPHGWGLVFVDLLSDSWACGGPGAPVVWAHFEPRSMDAPGPEPDRLVEGKLRDLLDVRMLLDSVKDYAIFGLDRDARVTLWPAGCERLTGYSTDAILGTSLNVLHQDAAAAEDLSTALARGRHEHEGWMYRRDGSRFWADSVITPILDSGGTLRGFSVVARDITWRKRLEEEREGLIVRIKHLARSDDLTGLPNRRRWHEELDRELARARRGGAPVCVAMVDLDRFKEYNDLHGHLGGDELLRTTARAWSDAVRTTDMLARYGGDEFSVILPECALEEATTVVGRLCSATPDPVTCSAGVACSNGGEPAETLVRRADEALYQAKRSGRSQIHTAGP